MANKKNISSYKDYIKNVMLITKSKQIKLEPFLKTQLIIFWNTILPS